MTEQDFWKALEKATQNWQLRLEFSDWLEERGEMIWAEGQRWQIENRKIATLHTPEYSNLLAKGCDLWGKELNIFTWWKEGVAHGKDAIPEDIFKWMNGQPEVCEGHFDRGLFHYTELSFAEKDLAQALYSIKGALLST